MKKFFKIFLLLLLVAVVVWTFFFLWKKSRPKELVYESVPVEIRTIEKKSVATGKVEPRNEIQIKPQIAGIIDEIYKEAGQLVRKDEVIARIKVIPDMVSLNSAESRVKIAKVNLEQERTLFERQKELYARHVISKEEYEASEVSYQLRMEEYETAKDNLDLTKEGATKKSGSQTNTLVRSTIEGMILDIPVKVGNSVIQSNNFNDGTTIATIADMNDMLFIGKIDETEVGQIHEGMPLNLTIGALNDHRFDAHLEYISPKGVDESGAIMFEVKAAANIPSDIFVRSGYSANAEITLQSAKDILSVPESTLEFANDSVFVQVVRAENPQVFERRAIEVGLSDGIYIEVKKGLSLEEKVKGNLLSEQK